MYLAHVLGRGRVLCTIILAAAFATACIADDNTEQTPKLPADVTLSNGAILHNVSVVRWEKDQVTLKHSGGADPVRYVNMAPADRKVFEDARDYFVGRAPDSVTLTGQAFIQTKGAGPSILGSVTVYAFQEYALSEFGTSGHEVDLPTPLASAVTDADGRFKLKIPGTEPFFVFAQASRRVGDNLEHYEWRIDSADISDRNNLLLTNNNMSTPTRRKVVIAQ